MANLATEIKNLWDNYPKAPKALIASETARDAAIADFFTNLKANAKEDDKVLKDFVYAVSAVIANQFNADAKVAEVARQKLAADLNGVAPKASGAWETYRKHAMDSLTTASNGSIDVNKVAAHYQLDNGLLTTNAANELTYVTLLQTHIRDHLVKDDDVPMTPPKDFVHHLLYLYLYGSRNHYDTVMAPFEPIRSTPRVSPLLQDEWNLLCAFPKDRFMTADVYYSLFQPIGTAVDAFIKAQTGTANSLPALTPPGAPVGNVPVNPPAPVVNPPAGNVPAPVGNAPVNPPAANVPAVAAVPVPAAPLPLALTPEQIAIRQTVDQLKTEADKDLADIGAFETLLKNRETDLQAAIAGNVLKDIGTARDALLALSEFKSNTKLLTRIDAQLNANADLEAKMKTQSQAFASQQADLVSIRDSVQKMYDDPSTGIHARERAANALSRKLQTDSITALRNIGKQKVDPIIAAIEAARDTVQGEAKVAQVARVSADNDYNTFLRDRAEFQPRSKLEDELRLLKKHKNDIDAHAQTILAEQKASTVEIVALEDYEKKNPTWWSIVGPKALTSAQKLAAEIASFKADVEKYSREVQDLIADVSKNRLGIEEAKIQFKAPPPDPKKFKNDRVDQCNVWYHMFDTDRLDRSDAYRLAQLEAHPSQPWAINFESILDVIRVLEAAVKRGNAEQRSNWMMNLKDHANFYKMVENLIIATCEELKMAPPQPNTLDEKMLLFVATGASLHDGVQWAYANDQITAWKFLRLTQIVNTRADRAKNKIAIAGNDMDLLTQSRHVPKSQSVKAPQFVRIEEAY